MGEILSGKLIANNVKEEIKSYVTKRKECGKRIPKIASILVGNDGGSIYYMNNQEKIATSLGVDFEKVIISEEVEEEYIIDKINELNKSSDIQGIILQLPLPKKFNEKNIIKTISPKKDIDCLTYESQGKLYTGDKGFLPCTPNSVVTILESLDMDLTGKEVVVLGRSNIVGKPVAQLLLNRNATVTICHSKTKNLKDVCKRADILIVAIGKPLFINSEYIKDDAIVIDVGTSSHNGKITGDVDFEEAIKMARFVTPVPGGVGALTTTLLIKNVCEALELYED